MEQVKEIKRFFDETKIGKKRTLYTFRKWRNKNKAKRGDGEEKPKNDED